jgi:hypothetical protein
MNATGEGPADAGTKYGSGPGNGGRRRLGCIALLVLIGCTLGLDFLHGIRLGEDQTAFEPIYRLRQSLAVAISRLRSPLPEHYLAYGSVVNALSEKGFALFGGEPGPRFSRDDWDLLLADGPRVDRAIKAALDVSIDPSLPPDIIRGNELGFADYAYLSFILFGAKVSSFYYFFFLLTLISCVFFVRQFRESPILLFLAVIFLAELYFLEDYAHGHGIQAGTVSNSRLFSGLSLLPALHVLLLLWRRQPLSRNAATGAVLQSLLFVFLLSCRTEVAWQGAMIVAAGCGIGVSLLWPGGAASWGGRLRRLRALWPAAIFVAVVAIYNGAVSFNADDRYAHEPEAHNFWEPVLGGILSSNEELRREYVNAPRDNFDQQDSLAIRRDINLRHDATSPIVHRLPDGQLTFDVADGWGDYDQMAKSLTLRIIRDHPGTILKEVPVKIRLQFIGFYREAQEDVSWTNLRVPILAVALGAILYIVAAERPANRREFCAACGAIGVVLVFALATPLVWPSILAIGTLFAYLGALVLALTYAASLGITILMGLNPVSRRVGATAASVDTIFAGATRTLPIAAPTAGLAMLFLACIAYQLGYEMNFFLAHEVGASPPGLETAAVTPGIPMNGNHVATLVAGPLVALATFCASIELGSGEASGASVSVSPSAPATTLPETLIDQLPILPASYNWEVLWGLNVKPSDDAAVVAGQRPLQLTAVPPTVPANEPNRHAVAIHCDGLTAGAGYRITAWVRSAAGTNVQLEVRDSNDTKTGQPADYGEARFNLAAHTTLSATDGLRHGVDQAASGWSKVWVDLKTADGRFYALVGLLENGSNQHVFNATGQQQIEFGGVELTRRQARD